MPVIEEAPQLPMRSCTLVYHGETTTLFELYGALDVRSLIFIPFGGRDE